MSRFRILFLLLGSLGVLTLDASPTYAQSKIDVSAIDQLVQAEMAAQHIPGLALAVTRGDQVLYVKGYGKASDADPVTPQTQFFIASLSKSFTALAVMQLVETGGLDLDAPVQRYLPEFMLSDPTAARQITVRHLLNQVSGLADAGFPHMTLPQPATPAERVASLRTARLVAPPGTEYHYFDVNYQVLARIVEVASGEPFSNYLQTHVFSPLEMANTFSALTSEEAYSRAARLAQGHLLSFGLPVEADEESGYFGGSGGVISTAEDMAHFLAMQNNQGSFRGRQIVSPSSIALMHTPPQGIEGGYAMGWMAITENGTRTIGHSGILSTQYSEMGLLPDTGYGIALLYNVQSVTQELVGFPKLRQGLIALLMGSQPQSGGWTSGTVGAILALLAIVSIALTGHSLLRLRFWAAKVHSMPRWRLLPGIIWAFVPAALVLAMPGLVLATGERAFSLFTLSSSMLGVMTWLGAWAVLSAADGIGRIAVLTRVATSRRTGPP